MKFRTINPALIVAIEAGRYSGTRNAAQSAETVTAAKSASVKLVLDDGWAISRWWPFAEMGLKLLLS
jgi:hypothetical protein